MTESAALLSAFVHGIAAGAMAVVSLIVWRSPVNTHVRTAAILAGLSIVAWLATESPALVEALGPSIALGLCVLAYPVGGLFWLFVLTLFDDLKISPLTLAPSAVLLVTGFALHLDDVGPGPVWVARNLFSGALAAHAGLVILQGWRGDLVEGRRRFRALLFGPSCLYVLLEVGVGFGHRLDPAGPWLTVAVGRPWGGVIVALLLLAIAGMLLQGRPAVFGAARRPEAVADVRAEAADRDLIRRLEALMAGEAWRREGLTIGDLARDLDAPEHRLRRVINQRLGHRNFADFLNGQRIEAAKRRLADPAEARTTIAAIAFDLGFGSLGPFNRAFRASTGATPTEWRRQALAESSPNLREAV